jgi:hypothetical protein
VAERSRKARLDTRLRRLNSIGELDERVCGALENLAAGARSSFGKVAIRSDLVRRATPWDGPLSDRRLPPAKERPPTARLLSPRGTALRVYLLALFAAQIRSRPGAKPANDWRIRRIVPGGQAWLNYFAAVTDSTDGRHVAISEDDQLERQFKHALGQLARKEVHLVRLPAGPAPMNRFEGFQLLHESGDTTATTIDYAVPKANEATFALPPEFFTRGWVHVLTNAEIAALMMMTDLAAHPLPGPPIGSGLHMSGEDRLAWFGLSKDTYDLLPDLAGCGLLSMDQAVDRRDNGTVEDYDPSQAPRRTYYGLTPAGFDKPALETVTAMVRTMRDYYA